MIENHPCSIPVEDNITIWRYMNISNFDSILENNALYFRRADKFIDKFEGSILKREVAYRKKKYSKSFDKVITSKGDEKIAYCHEELRKTILVSCWHINNNESATMWSNYTKDNKGLAIKTNTSLLKQVLQNAVDTFIISKVRYLNYEKDIWISNDYYHEPYNMLMPLFHKRKEFKEEAELRIIHRLDENPYTIDEYWKQQPDSNLNGQYKKINLQELIEEVVFHPNLDNTTISKVVEKTKQLGYNFAFKESKLSHEPIF